MSAAALGPGGRAEPFALLSVVKNRKNMKATRRSAAVLLALALAAPLRAGGGDQEVFEKAYSMEGIQKISVENVNGNIEATAWDKPYFKIRAVKKVDGSGSRAQETLRLTEIRVQKVGGEIKVE